MTDKIGRNDPCPCRSGKKYKQCCANTGTTFVVQEREGHEGAAERAIDWLMNKHRRAVNIALEGAMFNGLSDEKRAALEAQDLQTRQSIQRNATEWLLAEGRILVKGKPRRVSECLLGRDGPLLTLGQRRWLAQMPERPLRLYDVTDVIADTQVTLHDALDTKALPITVRGKAGSQASWLGTQIGLRIMEDDGHYELSAAAYQFAIPTGRSVVETMRSAMDQCGKRRTDLPRALSAIIRSQWLSQLFAAAPTPTVTHVTDGEALMRSLSAESDVEGGCSVVACESASGRQPSVRVRTGNGPTR